MAASESAGEMEIKWTEEATKNFINLRIKYNDLFTGKRGSAALGYSMIAREMGLPISAKKSLEKKWANLTAKYRMVKTPPSGVSTLDGAHTPITWPYYTVLDSFFSQRHTINPPFLIDTSYSPSPSSDSGTSSSPTFFPNFIIPALSSSYLNRPSTPKTLPPTTLSSLPSLDYNEITVPSSSFTPTPGPSSSVLAPIPTPSSSAPSSSSSTMFKAVLGTSSAATPDEGRPLPVTAKRKRPRRAEKEDEDPLLKYLKEQDEREQRNTERLFSILEKFFGPPPQ